MILGAASFARFAKGAGFLLGLTLLDHGWQFEANPGFFYFHKEEHKLNVFEILGQLRSGSFSRDQWFDLSQRLGISDLIIRPF
jgi:hypothetical protein